MIVLLYIVTGFIIYSLSPPDSIISGIISGILVGMGIVTFFKEWLKG
jgi:hypothetical protein